MATRSDIIRRVLTKLMVVGYGETPSPEEAKTVEDLIAPALASLRARYVAVIPFGETFQDAIIEPLVDYLTVMAAPAFGMTVQELALRGISREQAERDFRLVVQNKPLPESPAETCYF